MGKSKRVRRQERAENPYRIKQRVYDASGNEADLVVESTSQVVDRALASATGGTIRSAGELGADVLVSDIDVPRAKTVYEERAIAAGGAGVIASATNGEEEMRAERIRQEAAALAAEIGLEDKVGGGMGARGGAAGGVVRDGVRVTRGTLQAKHRIEWKRLKEQIADMRAASRKLSKHEYTEKAAKKSIAKQIKAMTAELKARHKDEIAAWEEAAAELGVLHKGNANANANAIANSPRTSSGSVSAMDTEDSRQGDISLYSLGGRIPTTRGQRKKSKKKRRNRLVVDF